MPDIEPNETRPDSGQERQKSGHEEPSPPSRAVTRADGITASERYLKKLCDRTFLSLWSYPNVYRDQGGKGDGKEVCDLLVVFENHVIIFSDKDCAFPDSGDLTKDWSRWFKRAVKKSADQVWGAERWIRQHPDRLFTDRACERAFPIDLPDPDKAVLHRIVVAHDSADRCRRESGGSSGSLTIVPSITGTAHYEPNPDGIQPCKVGDLDPGKGYVHVLDDTSLDIVLNTVDTITDFVGYLTKKEAFVRSGRLEEAAGEEELLALYLSEVDGRGQHHFVLPPGSAKVSVDEGGWRAFERSAQRRAQVEANEISYGWDALIEQFAKHIIGDTQYFRSHPEVSNSERTVRLLAREPRTRRRALVAQLYEMMDEGVPEWSRRTRVVLSPRSGDPYYVFMILPHPSGMPYEKYRTGRRNMLQAACWVLKALRPEATDIVGIATEEGSVEEHSEDAVYLDARTWSAEDQAKALRLQQDLDLFKDDLSGYAIRVEEYPNPPDYIAGAARPGIPVMKGRNRNLPCPCGSGKKFKKCCGSNA